MNVYSSDDLKKLYKNPENDYKQIDEDLDGKIKYFFADEFKK